MKSTCILIILAFLWLASAQTNQSVILGNKDLAVTIYNNDLGVVKDTRSIKFAGGVSELNFTDVASTIISETVTFDALNTAVSISVLEQNF